MDWLTGTLTLLPIELIARRDWRGWTVGLANQILWAYVLLSGLPGVGKTMLARRLPTILPPLTLPEALEVTTVWSVAGRIPAR